MRTEKGVVGYDLTRLFVGSEGTLGIFTRLILRVLPLPERKSTYLLTFPSLAGATGHVSRILAAGITPCTLEYMDRTAIKVVRERIPLELSEDTAALLLLELDGSSEEVDRLQARLLTYLTREGIAHRQANSEAEAQEIWQARRAISPATFALKPHKISEDVVVPRSKIPDLVNFTEELAREFALTILTFGHAGDGNIHVNIMLDKDDPEQLRRGEKAKDRLFRQAVALDGTGRHGFALPIIHAPDLVPRLWLVGDEPLRPRRRSARST